MHFQNVNLDTYQHKDLLKLFDDFPGEIHPDVGNFTEAPTGEFYWSVTHEGRKAEGQSILPAGSYESAFGKYKDFLSDLFGLFDNSMTLYFRMLPTVVSNENGKYIIWSRFLISGEKAFQSAEMKEFG